MDPANLVIQPTEIRVYDALDCGDLGSSVAVSPSRVDLPADIIDGARVCRADIIVGIGLHKSGDIVTIVVSILAMSTQIPGTRKVSI